MLQRKLEAINTKLDALALQKRLEIEDEHLKRIKCTKFVRMFCSFTGSSLKINTRILNELGNEEKTSFWDIVKRICICLNTDYVTVEEAVDSALSSQNTSCSVNGEVTKACDNKEINNITKLQQEQFNKSGQCQQGKVNSNKMYQQEIDNTCVQVNQVGVNSSGENEQDVLHCNSKLSQDEVYNKTNYYPELFEWTKDSQTDGFAIPITPNCNKIQIMLKFNNQRNVYKLNNKLSKLFNKYSDTKHNIIKDMYKYVNANKLSNYASSNVTCDERLKDIFNVDSFNFNNISTILEPFFEPIPYCCINIPVGKNDIWDVEVDVDDLGQMPVLYPNVIQNLEKKIQDTKSLIKKTQDKVELLEEFCENPALFINRKIALDSEGVGVKTVFYDNLNVQTGLFELIKRKDQ